MTDLLNRLARRWQRLSPRTSAILLQLLLWVLLTGFYILWNSRPNYHFSGPIWPLILMQLGFAVVLFNSLVYLIIPRWLLQGRVWLALAGALVLMYGYRIWMYVGSRLAETYVNIDPSMRRTLHAYYVEKLWADLGSPLAMLGSFVGMLAPMLFPLVISFLAYALVVDRRRLALERDNLRLERSYLKAQINPQFLFNTLGSLNAMTHARDERAGDVVLHLADLMRYTLYETEAERVPLSRELEFLDDYLALERLRSPATTVIEHEVSGPATTQQIAPLLLHPFLERLFAGLEAAPAGPVAFRSHMQVDSQTLTLDLRRTSEQPWPQPYATDAALLAARRRLGLQYPGSTRWSSPKRPSTFTFTSLFS
ncbi:sensor histidine kinase [Hymenobacter cellulosilyticus]|uniref:Histidine kinase n=1 Tax=Hymenobacter cellulosilyticus TaxID=2932248 RepID=A0A8T9PYZ6_9BACT|nr:sensor histidine kinase [Hymenobacter cellulosilyticus]UOQ70666.1 histidine kinase [Hymenobacter cellulosilyticus]